MNYIFSGNIKGCYLNNCSDVVSKTKVKIYGHDKSVNVSSSIEPTAPQTILTRTQKEILHLSTCLIAETETDEAGNYSVELNEKYNGGTVDIDICCIKAPIHLQKSGYHSPTEKQFHIGTVKPFWKQSTAHTSLHYYWEYQINAKQWASLLKAFKLHIICGRVHSAPNNYPITEGKVFAYDLDLLQDDYSGMAITDDNGYFKLFYSDDGYQKTIFDHISSEWKNCPDVYFRIENSAGEILLQENRKCGNKQNRRNAGNCLLVNFDLNQQVPT